jgi:hypothetical protein
MSRFDYPDPSTDAERCNALSAPPPFDCLCCGQQADDDQFWPYCGPVCVARTENESEEDR